MVSLISTRITRLRPFDQLPILERMRRRRSIGKAMKIGALPAFHWKVAATTCTNPGPFTRKGRRVSCLDTTVGNIAPKFL